MARHVPRLLLHGLLVLASFAVVSSWIRGGLDHDEAFGLRAKMEAFEKTRDDYDAVYIGASRTFRTIIPSVIDPIVSRRGRPFRSFNLGMAGMRGFEADQMLAQVLAMGPAKLEWVFVEAQRFQPEPCRRGCFITERSIRWHAPETTARLIQSIWLWDQPLRTKLDASWLALSQMAMRAANFGLGPSGWSSVTGRNLAGHDDKVEMFRTTRGYQKLAGSDVPQLHKRRLEFLYDREKYEREIAALREPQESEGLDEYNLDALASQVERLDGREIKVVYFVLPNNDPGRMYLDLAEAGHIPELLYYKKPNRYPELYEFDARYDVKHVSHLGAKRFSRVFGRDLRKLTSGSGAR